MTDNASSFVRVGAKKKADRSKRQAPRSIRSRNRRKEAGCWKAKKQCTEWPRLGLRLMNLGSLLELMARLNLVGQA